jgi:hypothetical protein
MFLNAGFYKYVYPTTFIPETNNDIVDKLIHRVSRERVKTQIAADVCMSAMRHSGVTNTLLKRKLYTTIIECMANTWNHARGNNENTSCNWWLLAYKEQVTNTTKFCFLDMGVGIFKSIDSKYKDNSILPWLKKIVDPSSNKKTLEKIFQGSNLSSTDLPERGLGLISIYKNVKNNPYIRNFTLLSNDILAKVRYNMDDEITSINSDFKGTLYYWELINSND